MGLSEKKPPRLQQQSEGMTGKKVPMTTIIRVKREKTRKPTAPRTCCPTHTDTCKFGRQHVWSGPYLLNDGRPVDGEVWSQPDSVKCAYCNGTCDAEVE